MRRWTKVDELVSFLNRMDSGYRGELKELNKQNFARFDDKLERRVAQLEARIDQRMAQLDAKIDRRATELDAKIDQRMTLLDARFDQLRVEIAAARADTIKWMFVFVATAVLAILSLG